MKIPIHLFNPNKNVTHSYRHFAIGVNGHTIHDRSWLSLIFWGRSFIFGEFFLDGVRNTEVDLEDLGHQHIDNFVLVLLVIFLDS